MSWGVAVRSGEAHLKGSGEEMQSACPTDICFYLVRSAATTKLALSKHFCKTLSKASSGLLLKQFWETPPPPEVVVTGMYQLRLPTVANLGQKKRSLKNSRSAETTAESRGDRCLLAEALDSRSEHRERDRPCQGPSRML